MIPHYDKQPNFTEYIIAYYNDGKEDFLVKESGKVYVRGRGTNLRELKSDEGNEIIDEINALKPIKTEIKTIEHTISFYEKPNGTNPTEKTS